MAKLETQVKDEDQKLDEFEMSVRETERERIHKQLGEEQQFVQKLNEDKEGILRQLHEAKETELKNDTDMQAHQCLLNDQMQKFEKLSKTSDLLTQ